MDSRQTFHPSAKDPELFTLTASTDRLARGLLLSLVSFELLLVILDATIAYGAWIQSGAIRRLFNLTRDDGLGDWFASVQTLWVGLISWLIVFRLNQGPTNQRWGWGLIALFFTYLAVDDGAKIHERIGTAVKGAGWAEGFPSYTWQWAFGPILGIMALWIFLFLWKSLTERRFRKWFILGLVCYVVSVGLDFTEGLRMAGLSEALGSALYGGTTRHFAKVVEEFLEMLGSTFFLICFLYQLARISPSLVIRFNN